jgi:hypothetical protein
MGVIADDGIWSDQAVWELDAHEAARINLLSRLADFL